MKVLKFSKNLLTYSGIYSDRLTDSRFRFLLSINAIVVLSGLVYSLSWTSAHFVYENINDIKGTINAFINFTGGLTVACAYITVGFNMNLINQVQAELEEIVGNGKRKIYLVKFSKLLIIFYVSRGTR